MNRRIPTTDNDQPPHRFQFSLKSLLVYSLVTAVLIAMIIRMASLNASGIGFVVLFLIVTAPLIFFAQIVDWLLGVDKNKQ